MKKVSISLLVGLSLFFMALSCSKQQESPIGRDKDNLYIDSLKFRHYKKDLRPWLASTTTFACSDSMSQVLDTLDLELLAAMNSTDRSYDEPLSYKQHLDTIIVDLIYSRGKAGFAFGEIKARQDSIFITLSGQAYRDLPRISERFKVPYRYYRSEFRILVDTTKKPLVFFRHRFQ